MPTGPKGEKRPADVIGNAVRIARTATGEEEDVLPSTTEAENMKAAAAASGAEGGRRRSQAIKPERRTAIASVAAKKRWSKDSSKVD